MLGYYAQGIIYCWEVKVKVKQKDIETLNLVYTLIYEKAHKYDLDLYF